jgi:heme/copper-type cytochrome/quinol oxidase subunit 4
MLSEKFKNRVAALTLIPFLSYIDNLTIQTGGIAAAVIAFIAATLQMKLFPSLFKKHHTIWSETGFFVTMYGVIGLVVGEYKSAVALFCVGMIGIISIKLSVLLWTANPITSNPTH